MEPLTAAASEEHDSSLGWRGWPLTLFGKNAHSDQICVCFCVNATDSN